MCNLSALSTTVVNMKLDANINKKENLSTNIIQNCITCYLSVCLKKIGNDNVVTEFVWNCPLALFWTGCPLYHCNMWVSYFPRSFQLFGMLFYLSGKLFQSFEAKHEMAHLLFYLTSVWGTMCKQNCVEILSTKNLSNISFLHESKIPLAGTK